MELTCPKCHGTMRTYERNGVHVDQCTECRGIFLDRGELERLMDAESTYYGQGTPQSSAAPAHRGGSPGSSQSSQSSLGGLVGEVLQQVKAQQGGGHRQQHGQQPYRKKSKSSFLGEIFG
ncbi:zf-TFIIB domain-containing protein [Aquipuribacter nitratireducens]|uniref:Zf-TFIIB domain-containing protein n=1 Tax=Aquipuribacter nitratireducens TaxID=650104 RepID=A0ABW0GQR7_9MICO